MIRPRTMPGVMELLPREQVAFQRMLDTIRRGYERHGFAPIETPAIEFTDILLTKSGGETEKQVYFVQSSGSLAQDRAPEMALRFDLTVPLARYVAEHEARLTFPFRRYQIQRVYRGESAQRGRFREFYQADVDVVGKDTLALGHDAEIAATVAAIFRGLGAPATIRLSNRKVLTGLLADLGVADGGAVLREVDKLDKRGMPATVAALRPLMPADAIGALLDVLALNGSNDATLAALEARSGGEVYRSGIAELRAVVDGIALRGEACRVDLTIARGLDYYTGTVYETTLDAHPEIGSVCSGGRYDDLASHYTRSRLPGVGLSIGATRLFDALRSEAATVDVVLTRFDPSLDAARFALAAELRAAGLRVETIVDDWRPKRQMQHVDRVGAAVAVILGGDEAARGVVAVKDTRTGAQVEVPRSEVVQAVKAMRG